MGDRGRQRNMALYARCAVQQAIAADVHKRLPSDRGNKIAGLAERLAPRDVGAADWVTRTSTTGEQGHDACRGKHVPIRFGRSPRPFVVHEARYSRGEGLIVISIAAGTQSLAAKVK